MKRPFVRRALAGMAITLLVLAGCARPDSDGSVAVCFFGAHEPDPL